MNRKEFNESVALRFEKERINLGYTQREMSAALGVSLTAYKRLITGDLEKIDAYILYKLFLVSGFVIPIVDRDPLSSIITDMRGLSSRQLAFIHDVVRFEASFVATSDQELSVLVPTGCMEDGMLWDSANIEKVKAPYREGVTCGVKVTSNHLHPVYTKGDVLLVSQRPVRDGDTGIFIHKPSGRAYLRKFRQTSPAVLEPINGFGAAFYINSEDPIEMSEWIKFGVVVSKLR